MRMKRILFVEDNDILLQLYGMMLQDERTGWQATTAPNGPAALELLHQSAFDVVASDMRMPGMSGAELLSEVRRLHPQTSRIIISGIGDQGEAAEMLNCTHLFIPKPFEAKTLKATLARISSLDAYLKSDTLRGLAGRMRTLPSFPLLYQQIIREIESPDSSLQAIARTVAQDPGITAKLLQVANSAAIGLPERVNDPVTAVQQLGLTTVRALVLSAQVYSSFQGRRLKHFSADALWSHLMKCGSLARAIMLRENAGPAEADDAFTAGMLHDMGKLMLANSLPDEFEKALALADAEQIPLADAEREIFGATHAGLAAFLFGLWGLPAAMVEAVAFHHEPEKSDLKQFSALTAVHVANALCDESQAGTLNLDYLRQIGVTSRLDDWREIGSERDLEPVA